ncbi:hypothetical protein [Noviherbaspirillum malthae]|uniref:hypothetical protein n=1 Tax=Noviherbaspirillum malthae TaxID=1260987 RepID=UPI001E5E17CA|nr:hypothetical protein [Noviherbaspirillum malthae]
MLIFDLPNTMKRKLMLMEAILGKLLDAPAPLLNVPGIAQRLNTEHTAFRNHPHRLPDKGWVAEVKNGFWRMMNAGHDSLEGNQV